MSIEPMTDEQLEEIDELLHSNENVPSDVVRLLADEVERLRAENAGMRLIVEAVANAGIVTNMPGFLEAPVLYSVIDNLSEMREQARAFVAAHPATGEGGVR